MNKSLCLAVALTLAFSTISCTKVRARMEIKEANTLYAGEKYADAVKHYEQARRIDGNSFPELDRMIGYSYIGLYRPDTDSQANEQYADKAIQELQRYLKKRPNDTIARDALINLLLNAERTEQAIDYFREWLKANPADLSAVRSIANLQAAQGDFNEALNWYEKVTLLDARNPESFYTFGVVCWEKVAKNPPADIAERLQIIEKGKRALERAVQLQPENENHYIYINLLYREQAKVEEDFDRQQELIAKAEEYRSRAVAIINEKKQRS